MYFLSGDQAKAKSKPTVCRNNPAIRPHNAEQRPILAVPELSNLNA
jgi:hypothetical protein